MTRSCEPVNHQKQSWYRTDARNNKRKHVKSIWKSPSLSLPTCRVMPGSQTWQLCYFRDKLFSFLLSILCQNRCWWLTRSRDRVMKRAFFVRLEKHNSSRNDVWTLLLLRRQECKCFPCVFQFIKIGMVFSPKTVRFNKKTVRSALKSKFSLRTQMFFFSASIKRDLIGLNSSGDDPWTNQLRGS